MSNKIAKSLTLVFLGIVLMGMFSTTNNVQAGFPNLPPPEVLKNEVTLYGNVFRSYDYGSTRDAGVAAYINDDNKAYVIREWADGGVMWYNFGSAYIMIKKSFTVPATDSDYRLDIKWELNGFIDSGDGVELTFDYSFVYNDFGELHEKTLTNSHTYYQEHMTNYVTGLSFVKDATYTLYIKVAVNADNGWNPGEVDFYSGGRYLNLESVKIGHFVPFDDTLR